MQHQSQTVLETAQPISLRFRQTMDELIKLVRTLRVTSGLADRLRLVDEICRRIAPRMSYLLIGVIRSPDVDDVLQKILESIADSLETFQGTTEQEFLAWCRRIARRRIADQIRKYKTDRLQLISDEEIRDLIDTSAQSAPLSAADRHDLEYAMKLLAQFKPECREYLLDYYVTGLNYSEIAEERNLNYDNVRMKIGRCLDDAQSLFE